MTSHLTAHDKVDQYIERDEPRLPLTLQAQLFNIARSSIYYQPVSLSSKTLTLLRQLDELYTKHPFFGSRRMAYELSRLQGEPINRRRVQRLTHTLGLETLYRKPNLSLNAAEHRVYPYLLRDLNIYRPNQVWGTDITYIRMHQGFVYLTVILDWFSRYIVSWRLSTTLEADFCVEAGQEALTIAIPDIINSDQGVQFTSEEYLKLYETAKVAISMDGRGRCLDNIFTERFWRSLKYEEVYLKSYTSVQEALENISAYMVFYNTKRPHQSLN